jgi:hypothetical protein
MSQVSGESSPFLNTEQARKHYDLFDRESLFASDTDAALVEKGVATIPMPISNGDFETLIDAYETCLHEHPELLHNTYHSVDQRHGNEAGHVRKERKINPATGLQIQDPKSLFHFNEQARLRWQEQYTSAPASFSSFLEYGYEIHAGLISVARGQFNELEETHPNILDAYYPEQRRVRQSLSFMRILSYDSYIASDAIGDVAKPHFDIGGATIQAYADAPGFWCSKGGPSNEREFHVSDQGYAQFFMGIGHKKLYGKAARIQPLYHGVARIISEGLEIVPKRHAVILFSDAPRIDFDVTAEDTLPELAAADALPGLKEVSAY